MRNAALALALLCTLAWGHPAPPPPAVHPCIKAMLRVVEHQVGDIVSIKPLDSKAMGPLENAVMDALMKTSNRGYELRFRDGTKLGLVRGDMAGLDEFLAALADRLVELRETGG
jgi:hypothetical protein